jgi:TPR repeat protein
MRRAVALLREAANGDVPDALYDLALCYENGEAVARNAAKAVELYLRAALLGETQSVYEVGRCYFYGIGVERDRRIARVWFDRAKKLGVD